MEILHNRSADASFLVRPHPEFEAITFVSACSGHGFKHSAALGEALALRLLGRTPPVSLDPFLAPP